MKRAELESEWQGGELLDNVVFSPPGRGLCGRVGVHLCSRSSQLWLPDSWFWWLPRSSAPSGQASEAPAEVGAGLLFLVKNRGFLARGTGTGPFFDLATQRQEMCR